MITEAQQISLSALRQKIGGYMKERRLSHTLAVEREAARLSELYAPDKEYTYRCAALLHDITKELSFEKQLQLCENFDIIYSREETLTPKIFHSRTALAVIRRDFPEFCSDEILSAVRWHTTGHSDMTLGEMIIFLADYIEDTRTFESCTRLRQYFYSGLEVLKSEGEMIAHLYDTMILAFDMTVRELTEERLPIHLDTVAARNFFVYKKHEKAWS